MQRLAGRTCPAFTPPTACSRTFQLATRLAGPTLFYRIRGSEPGQAYAPMTTVLQRASGYAVFQLARGLYPFRSGLGGRPFARIEQPG